jgi:hypothetical protein
MKPDDAGMLVFNSSTEQALNLKGQELAPQKFMLVPSHYAEKLMEDFSFLEEVPAEDHELLRYPMLQPVDERIESEDYELVSVIVDNTEVEPMIIYVPTKEEEEENARVKELEQRIDDDLLGLLEEQRQQIDAERQLNEKDEEEEEVVEKEQRSPKEKN